MLRLMIKFSGGGEPRSRPRRRSPGCFTQCGEACLYLFGLRTVRLQFEVAPIRRHRILTSASLVERPAVPELKFPLTWCELRRLGVGVDRLIEISARLPRPGQIEVRGVIVWEQ